MKYLIFLPRLYYLSILADKESYVKIMKDMSRFDIKTHKIYIFSLSLSLSLSLFPPPFSLLFLSFPKHINYNYIALKLNH